MFDHGVYYLVHGCQMKATFGNYLRQRRQCIQRNGRPYSVRGLASRLGIQPSYISKVEREEVAPPSEATIHKIAQELGEDPDVLLALAGKVSDDLRQVILKRPVLFAELIRQLKDAPDHAVLRIVREVRDGNW